MNIRNVLKQSVFRASLESGRWLGLNRLLELKHRRMPIAVMYHGVMPEGSSFLGRHVSAEEFAWQIDLFKKHYSVVSPREFVEAIRHSRHAAKRILTITFDDGYENNFKTAVPILRSRGLSACFFICTGPVLTGSWLTHDLRDLAILYGEGAPVPFTYEGKTFTLCSGDRIERERLGGAIRHRMIQMRWSDYACLAKALYEAAGCPRPSEQERPAYAVMKPSQVSELLRLGMDVGSHTVNHLALAEYDDDAILNEIQSAATDMTRMTGLSVRDQLFSYPLGSYDERVIRLTEEAGHPAAFAVKSDHPIGYPLFEIPRIGSNANESRALVSAKLSGWLTNIHSLRAFLAARG